VISRLSCGVILGKGDMEGDFSKSSSNIEIHMIGERRLWGMGK